MDRDPVREALAECVWALTKIELLEPFSEEEALRCVRALKAARIALTENAPITPRSP